MSKVWNFNAAIRTNNKNTVWDLQDNAILYWMVYSQVNPRLRILLHQNSKDKNSWTDIGLFWSMLVSMFKSKKILITQNCVIISAAWALWPTIYGRASYCRHWRLTSVYISDAFGQIIYSMLWIIANAHTGAVRSVQGNKGGAQPRPPPPDQ